MNDSLFVYETFSSIQGESTHAGELCFFIRLAGCNLRCSYCDTAKALSMDSGRPRTVESLVEEALKAGLPLVEITGGEPMLQPAVSLLCQALLDRKFSVMMETNGSRDLSVLPRGVMRIVDWKGPSSGEESHMLNSNFERLRPGDEVKFMISDETDYQDAKEVMKRFLFSVPVLFSPVFGGKLSPSQLVARLLADRLPVRVNLQLHKFIWGADAEGV